MRIGHDRLVVPESFISTQHRPTRPGKGVCRPAPIPTKQPVLETVENEAAPLNLTDGLKRRASPKRPSREFHFTRSYQRDKRGLAPATTSFQDIPMRLVTSPNFHVTRAIEEFSQSFI
jgi:hypothetical protein